MRNLVAKFVERRGAKRVGLNQRSRIRFDGMQQAEIVIRNLSFTGFNGAANVRLKRGDMVSITLPDVGVVRATIKWSRNGEVAGAFREPTDVRGCFPGLRRKVRR